MLVKIPTALNFSSQLPLLGELRQLQYEENKLTGRSWLNGRHVVFGEVLEGYDVVDLIQNVPKSSGDRPLADVKIVKSGELPVPEEGIHAEL